MSGYKIAEYILQKIKNDKIIKKYEQDLSNAKFEIFSQNELSILGDITKSLKVNKNEKSNEIQLQIMNLENSGIPVNKFLEVYRDELNVRVKARVASSYQPLGENCLAAICVLIGRKPRISIVNSTIN